MNRLRIMGWVIASIVFISAIGGSWYGIVHDGFVNNRAQLEQEHRRLEQQKIQLEQQRIAHRKQILADYQTTIQSLIAQGLTQPQTNPALKHQAKDITLTTLQQLDGAGKGALLKYLYQSGLIGRCPLAIGREYCQNPSRIAVLSLIGADLRRAQLRQTSLNGANLSGSDLRGADLREK